MSQKCFLEFVEFWKCDPADKSLERGFETASQNTVAIRSASQGQSSQETRCPSIGQLLLHEWLRAPSTTVCQKSNLRFNFALVWRTFLSCRSLPAYSCQLCPRAHLRFLYRHELYHLHGGITGLKEFVSCTFISILLSGIFRTCGATTGRIRLMRTQGKRSSSWCLSPCSGRGTRLCSSASTLLKYLFPTRLPATCAIYKDLNKHAILTFCKTLSCCFEAWTCLTAIIWPFLLLSAIITRPKEPQPRT